MLKWPLLALIAFSGTFGITVILNRPVALASSSSAGRSLEFDSCTPANLYTENTYNEEEHSEASGGLSGCDSADAIGIAVPPDAVTAATVLGRGAAVPAPECVLASQREAVPASSKLHLWYLTCQPEPAHSLFGLPLSWSRRSGPKPCSSAKHLARVYRDFMESMKCLDLDPGEMFPLFSLESNFEPELMSPHGYGIGQLTLTGVRGVKLDNLDLAKPACAFVRNRFAPLAGHRSLADPNFRLNACAMAQPIRNFIYAGLLYKSYKSEASKLVDGVRVRLNLDSNEAADLTVFLTRTMYNGGDSAVRRVFYKSMRRLRPASLPAKHRSLAIEEFLTREILRDPGIPRMMRETMARYDFAMMKQAAGIEAELNGRLGPKVRCFSRVGGAF